jgi:hypothetical protein
VWDTEKNTGFVTLRFNKKADQTVALGSPLHAAQVLHDLILGCEPTRFHKLGQNLQFGQTPPELPWASAASGAKIPAPENLFQDDLRAP